MPGSAEQQGAVARLSAGQRACLGLVLSRRNSKEIAQELGISPHTVDQRLRVAMQTLGVSSRFEAARLVFEAEEAKTYQRGVYQAPHIADDRPSEPQAPASSQGSGAKHDLIKGENGEAAVSTSPLSTSYDLPLPLPKRRGTRNDLTPMSRLLWVFGLFIGLSIAVGIFIIAAEALARIYWRTPL